MIEQAEGNEGRGICQKRVKSEAGGSKCVLIQQACMHAALDVLLTQLNGPEHMLIPLAHK